MQIQTQTQTMQTMAPYPSLPASPTLTNPDMILPYGEYDSVSSPIRDSYEPSGDVWNDMKTTEMQFSIGPPHMPSPMTTPTTPIMYGNGTQLSDIGEVTEVESTPRRLPAPAERRALKQMGGAVRINPATVHSALLKRTKIGMHERKPSMESTSTITSEGQAAENVFADFDDEVSVDDSVFQGDDEESVADSSVADSYTEGLIASETQRLARQESIYGQEEDRHSSAALSRRAEQILLNAKRRLNNMEGNLTRARSTIYIAPSGSMSSIHSSSPLSRSTPSPPQTSPHIISSLGANPSRHRETQSYSPGESPGHSRVYSENSIPSVQSQKAPFILRSASAAAGYVGNNAELRRSPHTSQESLRRDGNFSRPLASSPLTRTTPPSISSPPRGVSLEPLSEDDVSSTFGGDRDVRGISRGDGYLSASDNPRNLTRSASSMQMRDLRDQMHDLKGRLSSLRDRAREDNMRRRSLQSLRTPSPFTAAEQWYTDHQGYKEGGLSADKLVLQAPWKEKSPEQDGPANTEDEMHANGAAGHIPEYASSDVTSVYEDVPENQQTPVRDHEPGSSSEESEQNCETAKASGQEQSIDGSESDYSDEIVSRNELEDCDTESEASVYHDTIVPMSHEDREDAFDYEHFFLHSAMGSLSQQKNRRRDSTGSFSSEDSVETTRGPPTDPDKAKSALDERTSISHLRNGSTESVATLATFATAEEAYNDDVEDDYHDNYAVQQVEVPTVEHTNTPTTAKRLTFGLPINDNIPEDRALSSEENRPSSVIYNGNRRTGPNNPHRPSVSSLESVSSTGSTRSFPLVNKAKSSKPDLKAGSVLSLKETLSESQGTRASPVNMLAKDDQVLVERVVASLGKCVLGLQEAGAGTYDSRMWRRRLDAARRVLEGQEGAM